MSERRASLGPSGSRDASIVGRFLDGKFELVFKGGTPGPGYAATVDDGYLWRNGERVGDVTKLTYDRDALGWWVEYRSWRGGPMDFPELRAPRSDACGVCGLVVEEDCGHPDCPIARPLGEGGRDV